MAHLSFGKGQEINCPFGGNHFLIIYVTVYLKAAALLETKGVPPYCYFLSPFSLTDLLLELFRLCDSPVNPLRINNPETELYPTAKKQE